MLSARTRARLWLRWSMVWNRRIFSRFDWPHRLRCDGYRPCGPDRDGHRTHMAQYCVRFATHYGLCTAPVNHHGEEGDADFSPHSGGWVNRQVRAYEHRIDNPPVRERDWREDPCTVCGRSDTCNIIFCYFEEDNREDQTRGV